VASPANDLPRGVRSLSSGRSGRAGHGDSDDEQRRWVLVVQMARDMKGIAEHVSRIPSMDERLSRVEMDVTEIKAEQAVHREILREHLADLKELKKIVAEHSETLTAHSADLAEIKKLVRGQVATMAELKIASHMH